MSLVGRQIGRYRILEQLGQGGMSVVYKGLDTALDREVAVKVLHPHLANKPESRKRLEREAKAVARLHHPNILEVFDYAGADAPDAYIVTEYIRGKTLRQFLAEESFQPPEIAAMVLHDIAAALAHAHDAGIIHRDLKPENVMVREDGVLKLTDFGIAKLLDRDEKMTMTGALVGSPAHMAPEIIEGEECGAEADVFSLGTMLYLFAVGKLPFTAPNTTATLKRILDCVYDDPRQVVPTVSDELAEIIATCLQRRPQDRYPTANKLRDALAAYLADLGLTRTNEELPKFFLDPRGYRQRLVPLLTTALLARAGQHIAEKRSAKALGALNLVLAHEPSNAQAVALLAQMRAKKAQAQRSKSMVRASMVAGTLLVGSMGAWRGWQLATAKPDFVAPLTLGPEQVVLANVQWPTKPAPAEPVPPVPAPPTLPVEPPATTALESAKRPVKTTIRPPHLAVEPKEVSRIAEAAAPVTYRLNVNVRPFGYLSIDDGAPTAQALQTHAVSLSAGKHTVRVTCDLCNATTREITLSHDETLNIIAQLKPATVTFDGYPANATVLVGAEQRRALDTQQVPITVVTPPEGSREMRLPLRYEVMVDGQSVEKGSRNLTPGQRTVVSFGRP